MSKSTVQVIFLILKYVVMIAAIVFAFVVFHQGAMLVLPILLLVLGITVIAVEFYKGYFVDPSTPDGQDEFDLHAKRLKHWRMISLIAWILWGICALAFSIVYICIMAVEFGFLELVSGGTAVVNFALSICKTVNEVKK